jgi:hypothetical protein
MINQNKKIIILAVLTTTLAFICALNWILFLQHAHSTFENYYLFRGCVQLLEKTDNYGICRIVGGQVIKIVKFHDKWYLDGDLPWACLGKFCFGL